MARRGPTIADGAQELIRERGPQTTEKLAAALAAVGRTKAKDPVRAVRSALEYNRAFVRGRDDRWYSLADQLEGAVFTVRPTRFELREEVLLMRSDLDLVQGLLTRTLHRDMPDTPSLVWFGSWFDLPSPHIGIVESGWRDGTVVAPGFDLRQAIGPEITELLLEFVDELGLERRSVTDDDLRELLDRMYLVPLIRGPSGWIPTLRSRQVLALRVRDGAVSVGAIDKREITGVHVDLAAQRIGKLVEDTLRWEHRSGDLRIARIEDVLELLVIEAPELLRRPLPPIADVIRRAGYEVDGELVGPAGTPWDELDEGTVFIDDDPWDTGLPALVH